MATTKEDLAEWFEMGVMQDATHMLVVCDTFDHEDYPVYVKPGEDVKAKYAEYHGKEMQKVMEVYDLRKDADQQLQSGKIVMNF